MVCIQISCHIWPLILWICWDYTVNQDMGNGRVKLYPLLQVMCFPAVPALCRHKSPWSLSTHTKSWISRAEESCSARVRIAFEPLECNTVPNCHSIAESFNSSGWMSFNLGQALLIQTGNTASFPESPALYQLSHFRLVIVSPSTPPPPSPSLRETSDC